MSVYFFMRKRNELEKIMYEPFLNNKCSSSYLNSSQTTKYKITVCNELLLVATKLRVFFMALPNNVPPLSPCNHRALILVIITLGRPWTWCVRCGVKNKITENHVLVCPGGQWTDNRDCFVSKRPTATIIGLSRWSIARRCWLLRSRIPIIQVLIDF